MLIRYRKTLINVFVNAIYLYDDKISFIFNSGDTPITIDDKLLSDIEADNKAFECSFLEQSAPPEQANPNCFVTTELFGFVFYLDYPY